ncbi:MAG: alpha/beta hydrolase [Victivallales bacterium]|nr:alpha/beta hydrolase [Victivallales bacterium]
MGPADYKYIAINGVNIAYTDCGRGQTVLLVHGFASFSYTWMEMRRFLPTDRLRCLTIDLKGYGYSDKITDDHLAPFDQAVILSEFIRRLELDHLILVGHSMGGAISLIALFHEEIRHRVTGLVLIDSAGLFQKLPRFIDDLTSTSPTSPLVKLAKEDLLASLVLHQAYYDKNKITVDTVREYADVLRQENAKECLISAAKQIAIANVRSFVANVRKIDVRAMIIWGEKDEIIPREDAARFHDDLPHAEVKIIPECGHSPQEEKPRETAALLTEFFGVGPINPTAEPSIAVATPAEQKAPKEASPLKSVMSMPRLRHLRMHRLIDRWSLGTLIIIVFIKILQFLKRLGFRAEENGWRKATGIFLRTEHSKFVLASFRLAYSPPNQMATVMEEAKTLLVERLAGFLRQNPACHWTLEWGRFRVWPKKVFYTDITEAEFSHDGVMLRIVPYLDSTRKTFSLLRREDVDLALDQIITQFNATRNAPERTRAWTLEKRLKRWVRSLKGISSGGRQEIRELVERVLNGTFIQFETLPDDPTRLNAARLGTPNFKNRRHPGSGLLNIICRFTTDYREADLWFQHHHVPVDGMPMQEMLAQLKQEWGAAGQILYPARNSKAAMPEVFYFGQRLFRARIYVDFEKFSRLRHYLNNRYYAEMGGPATISSMLIWGLAGYEYFRDSKFLFPVDTSLIMDYPQERNISLIFIRPSRFFDAADPLAGFLRYQREFNRRLFATRIGKSESYELLELYAMTHPIFYYIAHYLMPKAIGEFLGTVGLTILRDAEMFVSPLSDLQSNGFVAVGNMRMPTEDGHTAGAISICGSKKQVRAYIEAFYHLADNYPDMLGIEL